MNNQPDNQEWQLAEMVDAIAAEIDRAEDTLSLKSYARGKLMTLKQLKLDLAVDVRYSPEREILFRTAEPGKNSATVLKLDFAQVLENQLQGVRKDLSKPISTRPLTTLASITKDEIKRLNRLAIHSMHDLERYTQTAAMLAEVSAKTDIAELKIRQWRKLPFFSEVQPVRGLPGSKVVIEGGNLGTLNPDTEIFFQGESAKILEWSESHLSVQIPKVKGSGLLFAVIDGQTTNLLNWEAISVQKPKLGVDLAVRDIRVISKPRADEPRSIRTDDPRIAKPGLPIVAPGDPTERDLDDPKIVRPVNSIILEADVVNLGNQASDSFEVQWSISAPNIRTRPIIKKHGSLEPNQKSNEESIRLPFEYGAGEFSVTFTVDPNNRHPDLNRENNTFTKTIKVGDIVR
ncbi:MAG: IPT/TIG domain-containing protein [Coleofasciculaceae cyanobacterium]